MLVQKIFFTLAGAFVYVYLFASVPGTFERQFELPHDHPGLVLAIAAGAVLLIVVLASHLPAQAARPDREGQAGRRDPRAPARVPGACLPAVVRRVAGQARRDRRVPGRLRDHGHVPHGDVGDGRQLDRQRGLRHAGRRRRQPGHQRGRPRRRDRRRRPPPPTRSASSSPSPRGTSPSRSCSWSGRSAGPAAGSSSSSPTPTPRSRSQSRRNSAPRRARRSARPALGAFPGCAAAAATPPLPTSPSSGQTDMG